MAKETGLYEIVFEPAPNQPDYPPRPVEPPHVHDRLADVLQLGGGSVALFGAFTVFGTSCAALETGGPWNEVWTWGFGAGGAAILLGVVAALLGDRRDKRVQRRAREEIGRG